MQFGLAAKSEMVLKQRKAPQGVLAAGPLELRPCWASSAGLMAAISSAADPKRIKAVGMCEQVLS